jgi:hypothetical protein
MSEARPTIPGPFPPGEIERFLSSFLYDPATILVDEVLRLDADQREIEARMETSKPLPIAQHQRGDPTRHPPHVSAPELIMLTGTLGCMHAWFFHALKWDEGWVGFGNRIHRADFKRLARLGPPLRLISRETRTRVQPKRAVLRYTFEFSQEGELVYVGDQTAVFVKDTPLT